MAVSTGALTVVRIGLRQHRVRNALKASQQGAILNPSEVVSEQCWPCCCRESMLYTAQSAIRRELKTAKFAKVLPCYS